MADLIGKIRRGIRKPPRVIAARLLAMARTQTERLRLPRRAAMSEARLLRELQSADLDALWAHLADRPFPAWFGPCHSAKMDALCGAEERRRLLRRAEMAHAHRVDLLGSGETSLGDRIDWHSDFKTGISWQPRYFADIEYNNPDRPSDVKVPWELSRLQWLMPVGQAHLLSPEDRNASKVRDVLEQWITANPIGASVNWSCTMEAALRVFTWVWFFHVFKDAPAWRDRGFRFRFLRSLYLHVEFTQRHIERSDVNGNHYTADAAALVVGGLFFDAGPARAWHEEGWRILNEEFPRQVFSDGVDFEASVPYHRLVSELFLWPAMCRSAAGLSVPPQYRERLAAMARFARAYSRPDGSVPLWGDADDARSLPFGFQDINDHRYLCHLIGLYLGETSVLSDNRGAMGEVFWTFGPEALRRLLEWEASPVQSQSFPEGGFHLMRTARDHVFIDCGPLGLAGRGGHGHNDCLAFEAVLDGVALVSDCGAYLYTANFAERNLFRSTDLHNTPRIDGEEINRFIRPDYLWNLHSDAAHRVLLWEDRADQVLFCGEHSGYRRLSDPVTPRRAIVLDKVAHALLVSDRLAGGGRHRIEIPMHLAPGVSVESVDVRHALLAAAGYKFRVEWRSTAHWTVTTEPARVSPSYGRVVPTTRLVWRQSDASLPCGLDILICPAESKTRPEHLLALVAECMELP